MPVLHVSVRALSQPCCWPRPPSVPLVPPVSDGGTADLYRGIRAIKTVRGWEQSSGAWAGSLLVSVSLHGAQGLAFLTVLRLCRRGRESCLLWGR